MNQLQQKELKPQNHSRKGSSINPHNNIVDNQAQKVKPSVLGKRKYKREKIMDSSIVKNHPEEEIYYFSDDFEKLE